MKKNGEERKFVKCPNSEEIGAWLTISVVFTVGTVSCIWVTLGRMVMALTGTAHPEVFVGVGIFTHIARSTALFGKISNVCMESMRVISSFKRVSKERTLHLKVTKKEAIPGQLFSSSSIELSS